MRLIATCWNEGSVTGHIPSMAVLCGLSEPDMRKAWASLNQYFRPTETDETKLVSMAMIGGEFIKHVPKRRRNKAQQLMIPQEKPDADRLKFYRQRDLCLDYFKAAWGKHFENKYPNGSNQKYIVAPVLEEYPAWKVLLSMYVFLMWDKDKKQFVIWPQLEDRTIKLWKTALESIMGRSEVTGADEAKARKYFKEYLV